MQNRQTKGTRCFVDADFSGDWNSDDPLNPENLISINGFVMMCSSMPFFWRRNYRLKLHYQLERLNTLIYQSHEISNTTDTIIVRYESGM